MAYTAGTATSDGVDHLKISSSRLMIKEAEAILGELVVILFRLYLCLHLCLHLRLCCWCRRRRHQRRRLAFERMICAFHGVRLQRAVGGKI